MRQGVCGIFSSPACAAMELAHRPEQPSVLVPQSGVKKQLFQVILEATDLFREYQIKARAQGRISENYKLLHSLKNQWQRLISCK